MFGLEPAEATGGAEVFVRNRIETTRRRKYSRTPLHLVVCLTTGPKPLPK